MKIEEQILFEYKVRLEELITEREGMIAENKQREVVGCSMAYHYDSFAVLIERIREIYNDLLSKGEEGK